MVLPVRFFRAKQGFSLTELVLVMAIVSILATLGAASVGSLLQGRAVANAVNIVSNSAATARQAAINRGRPVAFVISRATANGSQSVISLMFNGVDVDGKNTWTPITGWTLLPNRVGATVYLRDATASFYPGDSTVIGSLPATPAGGIPGYDFVVFQPDGSVDSPATGPSLTFQRLDRPANVGNYMLVLQSDSGRSKIIGN